MVSATKACRLTAPTGGAGTLVKKATLDFVPPCRTTSLTLVRLGANLRTPYSTRRRVIDLRCPRKESSRVIRWIDRGRKGGGGERGRGRGREGGYPPPIEEFAASSLSLSLTLSLSLSLSLFVHQSG